MIIKLEKLIELPNAKHPNNIEVGYIKIGQWVNKPSIGEPFFVGLGWATSPVTEIIDEYTFKTQNSIYTWTQLVPEKTGTIHYKN